MLFPKFYLASPSEISTQCSWFQNQGSNWFWSF